MVEVLNINYTRDMFSIPRQKPETITISWLLLIYSHIGIFKCYCGWNLGPLTYVSAAFGPLFSRLINLNICLQYCKAYERVVNLSLALKFRPPLY